MKPILPLLTLSTFFFLASCVKEEPIASKPQGTIVEEAPTGKGDPLAVHAWHLKNTGQRTFSNGPGISGEDSSIEDAHELGYLGEGIRIAVSDSGTETTHEDLRYNQLQGEHRNYFLSPSQWRGSHPTPTGNDAHGTAVAGIISASQDNGVGSKGVAPLSRFAGFKYIGATSGSAVLRSVDQMQGNFDIFNYSYGYGQCSFTELDDLKKSALQDGVTNLRNGLGAIYVQSAGNDYLGNFRDCFGIEESYPFTGNTNHSDDLATPEKIVVGAINASGVASSYSTPGSGIWISGAGGEYGTDSPAILTTDISSCQKGYSLASMVLNLFNRGQDALNSQCNYTAMMNGTSSAAPVVSGVIALILNANPNLTWRDVKHIIAKTADRVDNPANNTLNHPFGPSYSRASYPYDVKWTENAANNFFSNTYGFGRINALAAVLAAEGYSSHFGPYQSVSLSSGTLNLNIVDYTTTVVPTTNIINFTQDLSIESVQIKLNIDHPAPQDLAVTLISPSGTRSRLLNYSSRIYAFEFPQDKVLLTNAFYEESSLGNWTVEVADADGEDDGRLLSWTLIINGSEI